MQAEMRNELRERLIAYRRGFLVGHSDMIMSGLMALGGIVLIDCAVGPGDNVLRMILWLAGATTIWAYHSDIRAMSVWISEDIPAVGQILMRLQAFAQFGYFAVLSNAFVDHPYWGDWALVVAMTGWIAIPQLRGGLHRISNLDVEELRSGLSDHLRLVLRHVVARAMLATGVAIFALTALADLAIATKIAAAMLAAVIVLSDYFLLKSTQRWLAQLALLVDGNAEALR